MLVKQVDQENSRAAENCTVTIERPKGSTIVRAINPLILAHLVSCARKKQGDVCETMEIVTVMLILH